MNPLTPRSAVPSIGSRTVHSVHSLDELIAYLPYHLGFFPQDSLVVTALRRKALVFTARLSLHGMDELSGEPGPLLDAGQCRLGAVQLIETATRNGADAVLLFAYEDRRGEGEPLLRATAAEARRAGIRVTEQVVIHEGRRYLPRAADVRDRVDGVPLTDVGASPAITARTVLGRAPLADRSAVTAQVSEDRALSGEVAAAWGEARRRGGATDEDTGGSELRVRRCVGLWARTFAGGAVSRQAPVDAISALSADEVASLLASLNDVHWRDALIAWAAPGSLPLKALRPNVRRALRTHFATPPQDPHAVLHGLLALARQAPDAIPAASAPIAAVVGCVAWQLGEGATARDAHERALRVDPNHRLARLGLRMVALGIRQESAGRGHVPRPGQALGIRGERAV